MIFKSIKKYNDIIASISKTDNIEEVIESLKKYSQAEQELIISKSNLTNAAKLAVKANLEESTAKNVNTTATHINSSAQSKNISIIGALKLKYQELAASIGVSTATLTSFIGIAAGIAGTIIVLHKTSEAVEEIRNKAGELSNAFNDGESDIDNYKDKIEDLYKIINNGSSSIEEVTNARQTLLTVQDELIKKFGDEKESIDFVTKAIQGQTSALDSLIKKKWQATKNEFNESNMWNDFANWQEGYSDNIDRMVNEMENAWGNIKLSTSDYFSGEYDDIIQRLENNGWQYSSNYETFVKGGSVEDLYEEILDIQTLVGDDMPENFLDSLTKDANELKETLDDYEGMWDNYILNDKIFTDDSLANSWKEVNDAYTEYQDAVNSGDNVAIEEAISGFATVINKVLNDENVSDSVKDYFKDMYPALYREVEKWEFKTNIIPTFDTKSLNGKTQADILEMLQTEGTQEGEDVFGSIVDSAIKYGLILEDDTEGIQKILDLLVEWGVLQGSIAGSALQIADKTNDLTITDSVKQISEQLEPQFAKLGEAYKEIFTDNGFTLDNVDNSMLEELRTAFSDIEKDLGVEFDATELNSFFDVLTNSSSTATDVQNAFDGLATSYLNSTDVLKNLNDETAESVTKQLEQMGVTNAATLVEERLIANKEELALKEAFLAEYGKDLKEATEEETKAFLDEANATNAATYALFNYQTQEQIFNDSSLDVSGKVDKLMTLAAAYGLCGELLEDYNTKKELAENGVPIGTNYSEADLNSYYQQMQNELLARLSAPQVEFEDVSSKTESATEVLDKYFDYYEKQLQAGQITYQEYVQKCNDIRDKYYKDGKITSAEYYQYLADLYEKELEYHDKAISAMTDAIDDKIDELEKQKEELEDYYNGLIENIQSEIDKLQKANEERERAIALQKAQYELNRALNQRIDYTYQDGQFIYKAKDGAIRDAQNELDDKLFDMQISELEKQIEDLEKALEDATGTIDEQIDALNEYKDKWSDISSAYEESQNRIYAASILGANWEADVLDGRLDKLENFKNEYLRIQGELAKASVLGADPGASTSTTSGNGGDGGTDKDGEDEETKVPKRYETRYKVVVGGAPVSTDYKNKDLAIKWLKANAPGGTVVPYTVPIYAKGGVVGNDKSPLDAIAHSLNEDHMVAVKTGERILTPIQNSNFEKLINVSSDFVKLMKPFESIMKTPDFTKFVKNGNTKNDVVMNVSINCPNVTNESGFNYIKKELTSLTTKALQFNWDA